MDHRTEQEKRKERAYGGKTGSQTVQDKKDAAYREARGWNTKHGQEYAKSEMADVADKATKWSFIRKDIADVTQADYSKMSNADKEALARKVVALADIAAPNIYADIAAFGATYEDIGKADVSTLRKIGAHAFNAIGLAGMLPAAGPVVDALTYEIIGRLLTTPVDASKPNQTKYTNSQESNT